MEDSSPITTSSPVLSNGQITILVLITAGLMWIAHLLTSLHHDRYRYASFPQLPMSFVWGHLKELDQFNRRRGTDRHPDYMFTDIADALGRPPFYFLDLRPVDFKLAIITSHEVAEQVTKATKLNPWSVPKPASINSLRHLTGDNSLLTREGLEWKTLRKRFNPGFAPSHLGTLLPRILDKVGDFIDILNDAVRTGEHVSFSDMSTNLTFDVIGTVVLDLDMHAQKKEKAQQSELFQLYTRLLDTYAVDSGRYLPWWLIPRTKLKREYLARKIDKILKTLVRQRFTAATTNGRESSSSRRDVLSLSLGETITSGDKDNNSKLTPELLQITADQLKTFIFAGWDTTGVMLSWVFYELSRSPKALANVRAELDNLFGPETADKPALIMQKLRSDEGESLIQRMPYITAALKETLRLYPPASTARKAVPGTGFSVVADSKEYSLDGLVIYICARAIHRDQAVYGLDADEFVPERWLHNKTDASIPASAWRPFERGPRNCIGQELALIEGRVLLACVARKYDFVKVGLGELDLDKNSGMPVLEKDGRKWRVKDELYNTRKVTAKPVDGMMMKIRVRSPTTSN